MIWIHKSKILANNSSFANYTVLLISKIPSFSLYLLCMWWRLNQCCQCWTGTRGCIELHTIIYNYIQYIQLHTITCHLLFIWKIFSFQLPALQGLWLRLIKHFRAKTSKTSKSFVALQFSEMVIGLFFPGGPLLKLGFKTKLASKLGAAGVLDQRLYRSRNFQRCL